MKTRAQAALEFLMTYGWAILIMLVVISILFFLGVFNTSSTAPSSCVLPSGFTCGEFSLDSSGRLYLDLGQATGKTITVTGVGCGQASGSVTSLSIPVTLQTGSHAVVSDSDITCSGNYSGAFKGKLSIRYQPAGAAYNKTITGDLSAPVAVVSAGEQGQWNSSYAYYRQVTINTGVSSNLTNFPVYFILDTQHLIAWGRMNSTCKDLRVVNSTKDGMLDYEIENNTCNTTSTVVWFRVPQTNAANDFTAYVFYGNNSASDAQNKAEVWQNGFVAVYHMGDASDSTGTNPGTNYGASFNSAGKIGGAMDFNGVGGYIEVPDSASLNFPANEFTVTQWVKSAFTSAGPVINKGDAWFSDTNVGWGLRYPYSPQIVYVVAGNGTSHIEATTIGNFSWTYLGAKRSSGGTFYKLVNLAENSVGTLLGSINNASYPLRIGRGVLHGGYLNGSVDEIRISNVMRSTDWVNAEYKQTYVVGSEQVN